MCPLVWAGIAQSVQHLATSLTVRGSNPGGGEIFLTRPDRPCGPPSLLHHGCRVSFLGVKRRGRGVNHPPHLSPSLKKEWSYTSTPVMGLHGLFQGEIYLYFDLLYCAHYGQCCFQLKVCKQVLPQLLLTNTRTHTHTPFHVPCVT